MLENLEKRRVIRLSSTSCSGVYVFQFLVDALISLIFVEVNQKKHENMKEIGCVLIESAVSHSCVSFLWILLRYTV